MTILENYLKSKRVQKVLTTKPGQEGFSLVELVVVIAVLAILSAVAIPAFNNVTASARASAVQNAMVNGLKECSVRDTQGDTTAFKDATSFANATAFQGFSLAAMADDGAGNGGDSCFAVVATSVPTGQNSNFTIYIDDATGAAIKSCTNDAKAGCVKLSDGSRTWR
jgi:prepilin-type N-terminal cleavage/methylation domain-containing protein